MPHIEFKRHVDVVGCFDPSAKKVWTEIHFHLPGSSTPIIRKGDTEAIKKEFCEWLDRISACVTRT